MTVTVIQSLMNKQTVKEDLQLGTHQAGASHDSIMRGL